MPQPNRQRIISNWLTHTLALACCAPALADNVTECDRLAAHGSDPDKVVAKGVSGKDITEAAVAACQAATVDDPDNPRLRYQLARALAETGRAAEGHDDMHRAAATGYRQAQFVLGYLYDEGLQGLDQDPCEAAPLWLAAARQGLFAALVSYPHHVLRDRFAGCGPTASREELHAFLQQAQAMNPDYYQRLLIRDLLAELGP